MNITLTSTSEIVMINGVPARIWQGHTDSGIELHAFITRIAVHEDLAMEQFDQELKATTPPVGIPKYPEHLFIP
jgi:hypothetical protein